MLERLERLVQFKRCTLTSLYRKSWSPRVTHFDCRRQNCFLVMGLLNLLILVLVNWFVMRIQWRLFRFYALLKLTRIFLLLFCYWSALRTAPFRDWNGVMKERQLSHCNIGMLMFIIFTLCPDLHRPHRFGKTKRKEMQPICHLLFFGDEVSFFLTLQLQQIRISKKWTRRLAGLPAALALAGWGPVCSWEADRFILWMSAFLYKWIFSPL